MAWLSLLAAFVALLSPTPGTHPRAAALASRSGVTWFAFADGRELSIYRLAGAHLHVDGLVRLPAGFPIRPGETLTASSVIPGAAPTVAIRQWGADTLWFAVAARLDGRWRLVPFDDMGSRRHPYTFAFGASHHLIHGIVDSCGCASGPTTHQWYRFARGVFVGTAPPGPRADCSVNALRAAGHWPRLTDDPLLRRIDEPLTITRFVCASGWALATDGRTVGVYEQRDRGWLRVGIGSAKLVGSRREFALPRSLLGNLMRRIGVVVPKPIYRE